MEYPVDEEDVEYLLELLKQRKVEQGIPVGHVNTIEFERSWRSIIWDKLKRGWAWVKRNCALM
jgi:hypothetical protein